MEYLQKFNDEVRPYVEPAMFTYLTYFYIDTTTKTFNAADELSADMLANIIRYGMVLSIVCALTSLAVVTAKWFNEGFSKRLGRSTNPIVLASLFQLLSIFVLGHRLGMQNFDTAQAVAAGIVTLLTTLSSYSSVDVSPGNKSIPDSDSFVNQLVTFVLGKTNSYNRLSTVVSGSLVLIALVYNVASGSLVGPWYEALTLMLLSIMASLGLSLESGARKSSNLMFHVLIIFFLSKYLGSEQTADNAVALGLVIASGVLSVASHGEQSGKVRLNSRLNKWADLAVRCTHAGVAIVALLAIGEMAGDDKLLYAMARVGAILKLVACGLPQSQLEFLARNGSTLLLLLPMCALYASDEDTLKTAALVLAVAARGVDAIQNTIVSKSGDLLGNLGSDMKDRITALPPRGSPDNPIIYAVGIGLISASITLVIAGNEGCNDQILEVGVNCAGAVSNGLSDSNARDLRITIGLTWAHALLAIVGSLMAMFEQRVPNNDIVKAISTPSTLEIVRTVVSTFILGLLAHVAHQSSIGTIQHSSELSTFAYISLFSYIFVDTLGRNVV
tara:strand:- start:264 stop:1937 length:1674 start_codon:yes stop_codon:yes gene_type:complete